MSETLAEEQHYAGDQPRRLASRPAPADRVFRESSRGVSVLVLLIFGAIGAMLALSAVPTLRRYGWRFFTEHDWQPELDQVGLSEVLLGTFLVAFVALAVAFPLALTTALYISEYAPAKLRGALVAVVDLMAAVPSIVFGLWGLFMLAPYLQEVAHWINQNFGWIPIFAVDTDPDAAYLEWAKYTGSVFIAGVAVAMMAIPIACSVMREVFSQAPMGEREAALALGATRWGMVRTVVLPFGRGGIIGGTMLALGRALGETVAVLLIIQPIFDLKIKILEGGGITVSSLIANRFGEATSMQLSALLTAGFVLFVITVIINTIASVVVSRSRSGAATDI